VFHAVRLRSPGAPWRASSDGRAVRRLEPPPPDPPCAGAAHTKQIVPNPESSERVRRSVLGAPSIPCGNGAAPSRRRMWRFDEGGKESFTAGSHRPPRRRGGLRGGRGLGGRAARPGAPPGTPPEARGSRGSRGSSTAPSAGLEPAAESRFYRDFSAPGAARGVRR
jgi:hypothetical protein